ncbi:hypothetical protein QBC37DRAFT_172797 [Rhypophila decipiens]|uniref:Uncharacterized protein n=1 Tax=Rhypophila decipiens TaxID=261697 RepID=A0AAN6Y6L2_9PEZI|nr:hypothetical protein QBC37DRAFT_172797 [Rhypophila decipiens]
MAYSAVDSRLLLDLPVLARRFLNSRPVSICHDLLMKIRSLQYPERLVRLTDLPIVSSRAVSVSQNNRRTGSGLGRAIWGPRAKRKSAWRLAMCHVLASQIRIQARLFQHSRLNGSGGSSPCNGKTHPTVWRPDGKHHSETFTCRCTCIGSRLNHGVHARGAISPYLSSDSLLLVSRWLGQVPLQQWKDAEGNWVSGSSEQDTGAAQRPIAERG